MKRIVYALIVFLYWLWYRDFKRGEEYAHNILVMGLGRWLKRLFEFEQLPLKENWKLTARHIKTGEIIVKEGHNLIVNVGKYLVCRMLIDEAGYDTGLTYQAIGSNNTAPVLGDTTLTVESARKAVTSKTRVNNEITYSTFFTAGESTYFIKEAGMFGHSTATAAANSGVLFSHWLVSFDNTGGLYDITLDYVLTTG